MLKILHADLRLTTVVSFSLLSSALYAQNFSGSVSVYAFAGGNGGTKAVAIPKGKTSAQTSLSAAAPAVDAYGTGSVQPGLVKAHSDGESRPLSNQSPYGQSFTTSEMYDSIRLTGSNPLKVNVRQLNIGSWFVGGGTNQTDSGFSAGWSLSGLGVSVNQSYQAWSGNNTNGGLSDVSVTLQPGVWYQLRLWSQTSGDSQDNSPPYIATRHAEDSSLTVWLESANNTGFAGLAGPLWISASGHAYTQAVPEPGSIAALAVGVIALVGRHRRQ
ncbi:PEP-CTERM sorting domain-containing protein [bacterium]|nr:MAG: PEP-CTERM sorting domain-containing protein [bacterium]